SDQLRPEPEHRREHSDNERAPRAMGGVTLADDGRVRHMRRTGSLSATNEKTNRWTSVRKRGGHEHKRNEAAQDAEGPGESAGPQGPGRDCAGALSRLV